MSAENNNVNMTATENEIKATVDKYAGLHSDDLNEEQLREFCEALRSLAAMQEFERNELSESNANLIAEREKLMKQVEEQKEQLHQSQLAYSRLACYWQAEKDKVKFILLAIQAVKLNEYMNGLDFIKKIAGA